MDNQEIKIRPLTYNDRVTVAVMIRKLADKIGSKGLTNIIVSSSQETGEAPKKDGGDVFTRIGIEIVNQLLDVLEDDVAKWFADLVGKTMEEFKKLPFNIETIIIEQILEVKDINDFFTGALRAFNKMKQFFPKSSTEKTA